MNCDVEVFVTFPTPARGVSMGILRQYRGDAENIPYSVSRVLFAACTHRIMGGNPGKRMRHPD